MKRIVLKNKKHEFEVIVINGIPFCRFLDSQDRVKRTWCFFVGFRQTSKNKTQIIHGKPMIEKGNEAVYFGNQTWKYIINNSLNEITDFRRFGDLEKLCISSQLGGGLWDASHGRKLKNYLRNRYPNYFDDFSLNQVDGFEYDEILEDDQCSNSQQLNEWLEKNTVDVNVGKIANLHLLVHIQETTSTHSYSHYWPETRNHHPIQCSIL